MFLSFKKFLLHFFLIGNLSLILYFWYQMSGTSIFYDIPTTLIAFGRLAGLILVYCILLQFILMGRVRWVEEVFGLNNTARIHHIIGYSIIVFLLFHPILLVAGYSLNKKVSPLSQFIDFLLNYEDVSKALIALFLLLIIIVLSIWIVRKRLKYEIWYFVHLLTYVAVLLAWGHQLHVGQDFENSVFRTYWYTLYIFVFGNVLVFRYIRPLYLFFRHRFQVSRITLEGESAHSVYISGKNLDKLKVLPGQFLKVRFLSKKFWWQEHPFSFSMAPNDKKMRVTIKNVGDFTSQVGNVPLGTWAIVDGPYGIFTLDRAKQKKILFIAGGVGITPIRSLIEEAAKEGRNICLFYSSKKENDIILKNELDELASRYKFPIYYFITEENSRFEKGYITVERIKKMVKDLDERDVYICGPVLMMNALIKDMKKLGVPKDQIHYEKFSL